MRYSADKTRTIMIIAEKSVKKQEKRNITSRINCKNKKHFGYQKTCRPKVRSENLMTRRWYKLVPRSAFIFLHFLQVIR